MAFRAVFPSAKGIPLYSGGGGGPVFYRICTNLVSWVAFALLPHLAEIGH